MVEKSLVNIIATVYLLIFFCFGQSLLWNTCANVYTYELRCFRLPKHIKTAFCVGILCTSVNSNVSCHSDDDVYFCVLWESEFIPNYYLLHYLHWLSHRQCQSRDLLTLRFLRSQLFAIMSLENKLTHFVSAHNINITDFFIVEYSNIRWN